MADWLKKIIESENGKASSGKLLVFFHDILVGTLEKTEKFYIFKYDSNCLERCKIRSLEEDEMRFKYLPAFFTTRIPSRSRPELAEDFKRVGDDSFNYCPNASILYFEKIF